MSNIVEKYAQQWNDCGINEGDTVLLHSGMNVTQIREIKKSSKDVTEVLFESFKKAVGDSGTIIYPTFTFDFSNGKPYDIRNTPSQMGSLSEYARKIAPFRTGHPVYSFVVFGKNAHEFSNIDNKTAYGIDSPFQKLKEMNGKIAVLNLPEQNSMTFYHHVEQVLNAPYRFHKDFTQNYTDINGETEKRTYSIFVRDIDRGVRTDVNKMGDLLWDKGIYTGHRPDSGCGLRVGAATAIYTATANVITSNTAEGLLFSIDKPKI